MKSLLTLENTPRPIKEGDAGIVLTGEGGFFVFGCNENLDLNNLTARQAEQGRALLALSVALQFPQIMDVLVRMSEDPKIVGKTVDLGTAQ